MMTDSTETHLSEYSADDRPSTSIAVSLAEFLDRSVTDVSPLAESVDPEAVDRLLDGSRSDTDLQIAFEHEGCRIELSAGAIRITRSRGSDPGPYA